MVQRTWLVNKFYGWQMDYPTIITDGDETKMWQESYSVDWRKNPAWIQLWQYAGTEYTLSGDVTALFDRSSADSTVSWIIEATKTGNIYLDWVLKYTISWVPFPEIYGIEYVAGNLYYFTPNWVFTSVLSMTGSCTLAYTPSVYPYSKTIVKKALNGNVYWSNQNILHKLSTSWAFTSSVIILPTGYNITAITYYQNFISIYASNAVGGIKWIWDWLVTTDTQPNFTVEYPWLPILGADGEAWQDFAVMGFSQDYSDLYDVSWQQIPRLIVSNTEGSVWWRKFNGVVKKRLGIVYIWGSIAGDVNRSAYNCVFSYWNYHKWYPFWLQTEFKTNSAISSLLVRSSEIIAGVSGRTYINYIWDNSWRHKYNDIGEWVSGVFTGGKRNRKSLISIRFEFNNDASNSYEKHWGLVDFYIRKKTSSAWTLIESFNTSSITEEYKEINTNKLSAISSFTQIEYKVRMQPPAGESPYLTSPLITSIETIYDDNLRK